VNINTIVSSAAVNRKHRRGKVQIFRLMCSLKMGSCWKNTPCEFSKKINVRLFRSVFDGEGSKEKR